jgi:glyoxylase-like metal-dependent hydrolase (beta-lactamase superfamily II)
VGTAGGPRATLEQFTAAVPRTGQEARAFALDGGAWSLVLPLCYPGIRSVNAYLLTLADGLALVDCGSSLDPGWDALCHAVSQTGHDIADVRLLVCTHLHMDHAGLAYTVRERTGCRLARGSGPATGHDAFRDVTVPLGDRQRRAALEGVPADEISTLIGPLIADDGRHIRPEFDRELRDGERLAGIDGDWQVIAAPGHAGSQIVLFDARRGRLISADLVSSVPLLEYGSRDDPVALQMASVERAIALDLEMLLPGHGRPIEPASAVREQLLATRDGLERAVELAAAAIAERPRSGYELAALMTAGSDDLEWRQSALSVALCLLEHLQATGQARAAVGDDGIRRFAPVSEHQAAQLHSGSRAGR